MARFVEFLSRELIFVIEALVLGMELPCELQVSFTGILEFLKLAVEAVRAVSKPKGTCLLPGQLLAVVGVNVE